MKDLFREEVRGARIDGGTGPIRVQLPRISMVFSSIAVVGLLLILAFCVFGTYTHRQQAVGRVVPSDGLLVVPASVSGSIGAVFAREGSRVEAGERLLLISSSQQAAGERHGSVEDVVDDQIEWQRHKLEEDLSGAARQEELMLRELNRQVHTLREQIASAESQLRIRRLQAVRSRSAFERVKPLVEGQLVSVLQSQQYEVEALEKEAAAEAAAQGLLALRQQLSDAISQIALLPLTGAQQRGTIERNLAELSQAKVRNQAQQGVVLTAPRSGRVAALVAEVGQAVSQGQRLMTIIPDGSEMQVELWVNSSAIGLAERGGAVAIRLESYPYQTFGVQRGRIERVAESPLDPVEIRALSGVNVSEPCYLMMVSFDKAKFSNGLRPLALRAGMKVQADLLLERKGVYELLVGPVKGLINDIKGK